MSEVNSLSTAVSESGSKEGFRASQPIRRRIISARFWGVMEKARSRMVKRVSPLKMTGAASGFTSLPGASAGVDATGVRFPGGAADTGAIHRIPSTRGATTINWRKVRRTDILMVHSDYRAEGSFSRLNLIVF